jgi:hypothetical protein
MEVTYELQPDDFFELGKEIAPAQKDHKPRVIINTVVILVFILGDVIYSAVLSAMQGWNLGALLISIGFKIILTFFALSLILSIIFSIVRRKGKKLLEEPKNGLLCEHKIILKENELIELTDVNFARYSWKAIGEIKELESFVLIEVLLSGSLIIPKRYFQDRKHVEKFVETANLYKQNADNLFQPSHFIEYEKSLEQNIDQ